MRRLRTDDRAIRNVIGYVLVVAVVVTSVGVVSTAGLQQLETVRDTERVENARQSMELVARNFDELEQSEAAAQTSELDLSGGSLAVVNESTVRVGVEGTSFNETFAVGAVRYRVRDVTLAYESGALFWTDERQHTSLQTDPSMVCRPDRAVVSVVGVAAAGSQQVGESVASVTGRTASQRVLFPQNRTGPDSVAAADGVNVTVTSPRADGWEQHFSTAGNWTADPAAPDTYRCDGVEQVYVRHTAVEVTLST